MRLFVSVDVPELAEPINDLQEEFADADGLRFTDPTQAHSTLKFLGESQAEQLDSVRSALETAVDETGLEPFEATFGGLGVFPSLEYISVLWLGVTEGGSELTRLHESIESEMTALGYSPEKHDFTPHVTIARMEHAGGKSLVQELVQNREPEVGSVTVESVSLTESELTPNGPEYTTREEVPLDG